MFSPGERCPARIELSDLQVFWLRRRPFAALQVRRHHDCQLEFRHDGAHGDLGQRSDKVEWWVRWTLTSSAVEQGTACAAVDDDTEESAGEVVCLLFEGHPGRHSFDLDQV
ncbi:hypothetical protein [Jidongwangia harbinensis]|uniref:hypothetical protein n=1 Tax=Jidongwangia harbinensis TaxID=2878561 RepID=UPI001CD93467|nr:hypothetical protein [Jidongwangia harbinensis]MCA2211488.1 hypothetical protein [Jidongwangia harbinensis]